MSAGAAEGDGPDPVGVLLDLPPALWGELLRAVRRAVDRLPRTDLPQGLRPFAGWTPEKMTATHPREAIARALVDDPRLREKVGAALDDRGARALVAADESDGARLAAVHGDGHAVAALAVRGRWRDLAVVAAGASQRQASRDRTAAEPGPPPSDDGEGARRRMAAEIAAARDERDAQRRRADAAEERAGRADGVAREQQAEIERLRERLAALERQVVEERRTRDRRVGSLQRQLEEARTRERMDDVRVARVAAELERLAAALRDAVTPAEPEPGPPPGDEPAVSAVPRSVPAAAAGRPCRLPPGVSEDEPAAVRALLQVPGLEVVLDGYNVTKDLRGRPRAALPDQRHWLVRLLAGLGARFGCRLTVVFDGTEERLSPAPAARDVRVVFTAGEEIADERIEAIVQSLEPSAPVLVVSSDREVRDAATALGANVTSSAAFLAAAGSDRAVAPPS